MNEQTHEFRYHPDILEKYTNLSAGVIHASGLTNSPTSDEVAALYQQEQQAVLERIGDTPLGQIPALSAWRSTFRTFNVEPTKYRSAAEALLRRLTKAGDIPNLNLLVDLGNLISIRYALPVAVFDTRALQGGVTVRFATGSERYRSLGTDETVHPEAGEVVFVDEADMVIARRWCWRQSEESASRLETTSTIITIEAQHEGGGADVRSAVDDMLELLSKYAGGEFSSRFYPE